MDNFDWEKSIISLFGIFSSADYQKKLSNYNNNNCNSNNNKKGNKNKNINNTINEHFWYLYYRK